MFKKLVLASRRAIGCFLAHENESGHSRLCRFANWIAHWGPHGTFVLVDSRETGSGTHLCCFGIECGSPTEHYMQIRNEQAEHFRRTMTIIEKMGIVQSFVWENPRFSVASLCTCGHTLEQAFPSHDPLCPYRVEHGIDVTLDEYRSMLQSRIQ